MLSGNSKFNHLIMILTITNQTKKRTQSTHPSFICNSHCWFSMRANTTLHIRQSSQPLLWLIRQHLQISALQLAIAPFAQQVLHFMVSKLIEEIHQYSNGDCQNSSNRVVSKSEVWEGLPVYPSLLKKKKGWLGSIEMNFLEASYFS